MEVKIIFSKRKSLGLQVSSKGIFVRAPMRTPIKYINQLLEDRKLWIEQKTALIKKRQHVVVTEFLNSDEKFWLFGECLDIGVNNNLLINHKIIPSEFYFATSEKENSKFDPKKFYTLQLERYLQNKLNTYADIVGVKYGEVKVKTLKSKWGSCSTKGQLVFNSNLAKCPEAVIEYVIIHELCHRLEMNHSKRFWNLVTEFCPDWKSIKKWFKVYGQNVLEE